MFDSIHTLILSYTSFFQQYSVLFGITSSQSDLIHILHQCGAFFLLIACTYFITLIYFSFVGDLTKTEIALHLMQIILYAGYSVLIGIYHSIETSCFILCLSIIQLIFIKTIPTKCNEQDRTDQITARALWQAMFMNHHILWFIILLYSCISLRACMLYNLSSM